MNTYVTSLTIKEQREKQNMTQAELAEKIGVSSKTISKWETAKGLPDISLLQPLAQALNLSVIELMNGQPIANKNVSANLLRSKFYICPICGNLLHSTGSAVVSCCGITLPPLEAEESDDAHSITIQPVEDEHFVTISHPMEKGHYLSFAALVKGDQLLLLQRWPEWDFQVRLPRHGHGMLFWYCTRHGLFRKAL